MPEQIKVDGLLPPEMAEKAEDLGVLKGNMPLDRAITLSVLAGAYIAVAAMFCTVVVTGGSALPYGVMKTMGGLAFSLGLILVVVGGAELFTGNVLLVMAWVNHKLPLRKVLWNWFIVYFGNFAGSLATAWLIFLTAQYTFSDGAVGTTALKIAADKCSLDFIPALTRGIYCNALVCLGVWLCYACRTTGDKILAILFPITAFVAAGFEHSVANMYFIPIGLIIKDFAPDSYWALESVQAFMEKSHGLDGLTWSAFILRNLIPVTIGNIIGGGGFVGIVYWLAYRRGK